jgi:hypothetical protein
VAQPERTEPLAVCVDADVLTLFEEFLRSVPLQIHRPTSHDRERARELADAKDVPILAAAIGAGAPSSSPTTSYIRSGQGVRVVRPRTLIEEVRAWMRSFGAG